MTYWTPISCSPNAKFPKGRNVRVYDVATGRTVKDKIIIPKPVYVADGIGDHFKINTFNDYDVGGHRIESTDDSRRGGKTVNRWEPSQPV
jgi:hypothetical protein